MIEIWMMKIECVRGWYLEKVSAKVCEVQATCSLEALCNFILESFAFDNDHLHEFFLSRRPIRNHRDTIDDESSMLSHIFPVKKGYQLFMHFDFGDDWVFKITRSRTALFREGILYPRVIEHIGKNPEQYPIYEEHDE